MKSIFTFLLTSIFAVMIYSAFAVHIWTTIIAFNQGGASAGILSLIFPVISEIYWMIKLFGENNLYSGMVIIHFIVPFISSLVSSGSTPSSSYYSSY